MKNQEQKGLIFNIQRFSIHDGPGIRTTVFMKGCPLRCRWCSNPESQNPYPEIMTYDVKCIRCGKCEQICPMNAITISQKGRKIARTQCTLCLKCAEVCPTGAISISGKYMTIEEVMKEVGSDKLFYQNSGGGVTISGGEPLSQWEFVLQLLKECKQEGLHTALDTCGYAPWHILEKVLEHTDLILFDIKHINSSQHRKGTGKGNRLILDNAKRTAAKVRTWLRFPLIPGYNDSDEHVREVAELATKIRVEKVSILPYHEWGKAKYEKLGRRYPFKNTQTLSDWHIQKLQKIIENMGLKVTVGN
ncbi:MAG: glycyl-radical enzyme activating protein [Chloroflexi bacterium CG08_land_8_20_14_0_20_45_12]|nr:MAG: glycyl-radical enzyme activating protein [Chloroflexi bacterium CG08_land_8_20_14_0_20_45_12]